MRKRHIWFFATLLLLAIMVILSCGGGGGEGGGGAGTDTKPPTVSSTNPTNGATGVATSLTAIMATFSEAMNNATIGTSTFLVSSPVGTIAGSVSYNSATRTASFIPTTALVSSTTYTATITTGVQDSAGNPLAAARIWSFQTAAPTAGSLDPSFGALGLVKTDMGTVNDKAYGMAIQSDGKIVVVGNANGKFAVARYNSDGSLDSGFGTGGKVTTTVGTAISYARAVAIQQDGKILAAGMAYFSSSSSMAIVRYNTDGTLDTSFDTDGIASLSVGSYATAIAIDSTSGNIYVAGDKSSSIPLSSWDFIVARFTPSGALDTSFATTGWAIADFKPSTYTSGSDLADHAYGMALQADGKVVVVGSAENSAWLNDFAIARFNTDGTLSGKVTYDFGSFTDNIASAVTITNSQIVVAGVGDYKYFGVIKLTSTLALDTTFNSTGKVLTDISADYATAYAHAVQSDGRIIVAGQVEDSGSPYPLDFVLVRYTTNGSLDTGFGTGGKVRTDAGSATDTLAAVAIQSDGKIVAAGTVAGDFAVVRYIP